MTTRVGYSANTSNLILDVDAMLPASYSGSENILVQGALLSNTSAWAVDNCSVTANTIQAPDNTLSGWKLTSSITGGNNNAYIQQVPVTYSNTVWTYSVYLKQGTSPTTLVDFFIVSPYTEITATVTWGATPSIAYGYGGAGTASTRLDSSFTDAGNGWWRVALTLNTASGTSCACRVYVRGQGTNNVSGEYVYVWCPQIERGYGASAPTFVNTNLLRTTTTSAAYGTPYIGTLNGGAIYTSNPGPATVPAAAFQFNTSNTDFVSSYSIPASVFQGSYTASFWFKINELRTDNCLGGHGSMGTNQGLHMGARQTQLYFGFYANDTSGSSSIAVNTWYNATFTYNATTLNKRIYRNGVLDSNGTATAAYIGSGTNFEIGRYPWDSSSTGSRMNGFISKAQIYNVELSAADVAANFNAYRGRYGI